MTYALSMCYDDGTKGEKPEKGADHMPSEKEMKKIELATIYEIRLLLASDGKTEYTQDELFRILDQYAKDKNAS